MFHFAVFLKKLLVLKTVLFLSYEFFVLFSYVDLVTAVKCDNNIYVFVFQKVLQIGGLTLKHSRCIHHSPVWKSPLIPIVVEQTVSEKRNADEV